ADAANQGATSFKAYTSLRSAELKAAVQAAHERGLRITGHLCAVGYREAVRLGIDNLEHGLIFDTEVYSGKRPDECPGQSRMLGEMLHVGIDDADVQQLIGDLVRHGVAVTSTLAVIEANTGRVDTFDPRVPVVLSSRLQEIYWAARQQRSDPTAPGRRAW